MWEENIAGNFTAIILKSQSITWGELLASLIVNGVLFGVFLFAKLFRREDGA
ncbi:MAG: hypothetical protein K2N73_01525 [Lachnospiraceae bacterium]|nr:hypothetical protein [Lachnospiraceae bacterium]